MQLKTLYKVETTGKIRQWTVKVKDNSYWSEQGQVDGKIVEFSFKSSGDPALMRDIEDQGSIYVVMPMRV